MLDVHTHAHTHSHKHAHKHAHTHTPARKHTHAHTHSLSRALSLARGALSLARARSRFSFVVAFHRSSGGGSLSPRGARRRPRHRRPRVLHPTTHPPTHGGVCRRSYPPHLSTCPDLSLSLSVSVSAGPLSAPSSPQPDHELRSRIIRWHIQKMAPKEDVEEDELEGDAMYDF